MDLAEKVLNAWIMTKPQRKFLLPLFTTILALRGKVTFRNLNRYSDWNGCHGRAEKRLEVSAFSVIDLAHHTGYALCGAANPRSK